jgi:hypothetical protein
MSWFKKYAQEISPGIEKTDDGIVLDTSRISDDAYADYFLKNAGWFADGAIHAIHVTDSPDTLVSNIESGIDLSKGRGGLDVGDLGGGLYGSNAPQLWEGRAVGKYDFMDGLDLGQKKRLGEAILSHRNLHETGYLTESEREYAERICRSWMEGKMNGSALAILAGQPYNVRFWEPTFLKPLGIDPSGRQPERVEFEAVGRFLKVDGGLDLADVPKLREKYDGAFVAGGMAYPQFVVWKNSALRSVKKFVDPYN